MQKGLQAKRRVALACVGCLLLSACGAKGEVAPQATAPLQTQSQPQQEPEPSAQAGGEGAATETADKIQEKLNGMTTREKVGQLFFVRPDSLDPSLSHEQIDDAKAVGVTELSDSMRAVLDAYPVGGVALFGKNMETPQQLADFIGALQSASQVPLFVGVDEEGGQVSRLANSPAFSVPQYESARAVGDTGNTESAQEMGQTIGGYLAQYGFNLDFAPDADVDTNPNNPVIGTRAFSSDANTAAAMVGACVQGFHQAGVACCIKHFPGHGDTDTDTHYGCAQTNKTWNEMRACELLPFESGISAGTDMVMVAHITTPNVTSDGLPASLSAEMIDGRLRGELGYSGVVITDSMAMEAITDSFSPAESAVAALSAGADIVLMPEDLSLAFDGVMAAVENGAISEQRLNESVTRVLTLKARYGLL